MGAGESQEFNCTPHVTPNFEGQNKGSRGLCGRVLGSHEGRASSIPKRSVVLLAPSEMRNHKDMVKSHVLHIDRTRRI